MEQAGRILRSQATRKQVFQTILPLLSAGLIRPADGKRPAKKDYRLIGERVRALRAERQGRVRAALALLAEADREVLLLRYLEQLPLREVAAVLGVSESAVKMRHFRALERLRALLEAEHEENQS